MAIVLHGAHSFCRVVDPGRGRTWPCPASSEIANQDGLLYLTEALARHGFVALAPGINAEFAPRPASTVGSIAADVVTGLLDSLAAGSRAFGFDPSIADTGHVVLVGHSRGAALAALIAAGPRFSPPTGAAAGLVLLAPGADNVDPSLLGDVPAAIVIGSCDGDTGVDGGQYLAEALEAPRRHPVALILLQGATHNAANDRLAMEDPVPGQPGCGPGVRLEPPAQRRLLESLVPDLAAEVLGVPTGGAVSQLFDATREHDRVAAGLRIVHVDPAARRIRLMPAFGSALGPTGFRPVWCPAGLYGPLQAPGTEPCHRQELIELVGRPAALSLSWDHPGVTLAMAVPPGLSGPATLVIRALSDPIDVRLAGGGVDLRLLGRSGDQPIWTADVTLPPVELGAATAGSPALRRGAALWTETRLAMAVVPQWVDVSIRTPAAGSLLLVSVELIAA